MLRILKPSSEKWSQIRARGKRAYIIGMALRVGLVLGVLFSINDLLYQEISWLAFFVTVVVSTVAGALCGFTVWAVNEHEYKHHDQE